MKWLELAAHEWKRKASLPPEPRRCTSHVKSGNGRPNPPTQYFSLRGPDHPQMLVFLGRLQSAWREQSTCLQSQTSVIESLPCLRMLCAHIMLGSPNVKNQGLLTNVHYLQQGVLNSWRTDKREKGALPPEPQRCANLLKSGNGTAITAWWFLQPRQVGQLLN